MKSSFLLMAYLHNSKVLELLEPQILHSRQVRDNSRPKDIGSGSLFESAQVDPVTASRPTGVSFNLNETTEMVAMPNHYATVPVRLDEDGFELNRCSKGEG